MDAVNQRVRDCDRLDQAINEVPAARDQLDREHTNLSEKLATAEAGLALCDRGLDAEVKHLASVEKLALALAAIERERKRIDARELALEARTTSSISRSSTAKARRRQRKRAATTLASAGTRK